MLSESQANQNQSNSPSAHKLQIDQRKARRQLEYLGYKSGENVYLRFFYHSEDPRKNEDKGRKLDRLSWIDAETKPDLEHSTSPTVLVQSLKALICDLSERTNSRITSIATHCQETAIAQSKLHFYEILNEALPAPFLGGYGIAGGTSTLNYHKAERRLTYEYIMAGTQMGSPSHCIGFPQGTAGGGLYPLTGGAVMPQVMAGHPVVDAIGQMHFEGNIVPHSWYKHIRYKNKRGTHTDHLACLILADILYWFRPYEKRDELTGESLGWFKKFQGNDLRRNHEAFAKALGSTVRQVREAVALLKGLNLIAIEYRPIKTEHGTVPNVMHIMVKPEVIAKITYRTTGAETLETPLLTKWGISNDEIVNNELRIREEAMTKSEISDDEIGNSSIYRDFLEISGEISSSPLTPQGELEGGGEESQDSEKSRTHPKPLTSPLNEPESLTRPTNLHEDPNSGIASLDSNKAIKRDENVSAENISAHVCTQGETRSGNQGLATVDQDLPLLVRALQGHDLVSQSQAKHSDFKHLAPSDSNQANSVASQVPSNSNQEQITQISSTPTPTQKKFPWVIGQDSEEQDIFNPEFEEYLLKSFETYSAYQGKTLSQQQRMIRKYINVANRDDAEGRVRYSDLWIDWKGYQEEKAHSKERSPSTPSNYTPPVTPLNMPMPSPTEEDLKAKEEAIALTRAMFAQLAQDTSISKRKWHGIN